MSLEDLELFTASGVGVTVAGAPLATVFSLLSEPGVIEGLAEAVAPPWLFPEDPPLLEPPLEDPPLVEPPFELPLPGLPTTLNLPPSLSFAVLPLTSAPSAETTPPAKVIL